MKSFFKYGVVSLVTVVFLLIVTVLVLPVLINVQRFVPEVEKKISEMTGRSVSIGPDAGLSFFPWLSVSFSDIKLGNPQGFLSDRFLRMDSFDARFKLLPLLKKEVQISRIAIDGLEINLETREDGKVNWVFGWENNSQKPSSSTSQQGAWYQADRFSITQLAVTGRVNWNDKMHQSLHQLDDVLLLLDNVTPGEPIGFDLKASIDGKPLVLDGEIESIGNNPKDGPLAIDLGVVFVNTVKGQVKGQIASLLTNPGYDLAVQVYPFSPRDFFDALDVPLPYAARDSKAFNSIELEVSAKGNMEQFSIEKGRAKLDDSQIDFSLVAIDLTRPDMGFSLEIDTLNLDKYLVSETDKSTAKGDGVQDDHAAGDYEALRDMTLSGALKIGELQVGGGTLKNVTMQVRAADGIFEVAPASFSLYQGQGQSTMTINFQGDVPETHVDLQSEGVQAAPFMHDFIGTDFLKGTVNTDLDFRFSGSTKAAIKKSLNGNGSLLFQEGALAGIDLARTVLGLEKGISSSDSPEQLLRTDFSELKSALTIRNGLIESKETILKSPVIRSLVTGTIDLVGEQVHLKFEPQAVATVIGQGGQKVPRAAGPLMMSGSFTDLKMNIDGGKFSVNDSGLATSADEQSLVDKKLPLPLDEEGKGLAGKPLIDPDVINERFGQKPAAIHNSQVKRQYPVGSGEIHINPLREEATLRGYYDN